MTGSSAYILRFMADKEGDALCRATKGTITVCNGRGIEESRRQIIYDSNVEENRL